MSDNSTSPKNEEAKATEDKETADESQDSQKKPAEIKKRSLAWRFLPPLIILLLAAGVYFAITHNWNSWVGGKKDQKTDDASLRSDITPLSTKISGTVSEVAVQDYQRVKAGDLLVQIKDDDYRAQVEQAAAAVKGAQVALVNNSKQKSLQDTRIEQSALGIKSAQADIDLAEANVAAAKADLANSQANIEATMADVERTQLERKRQETLLSTASATKQKIEQVVADEERFHSNLASRRAEHQKACALLAQRQAELERAKINLANKEEDLEAQKKQRSLLDVQEDQLKADLSAKEASLKSAHTYLEYTRILAPIDGVVGERKVRVGQLVSPGTQVISIVEPNIWIQANYKETQLTNVHKGDPAEATVDAFPGVILKGRVEEIAPASGSQFALLPPDNATGNYTKVVQRIPVKIVLDLDPAIAERLRPGMSVIAEIKTATKK